MPIGRPGDPRDPAADPGPQRAGPRVPAAAGRLAGLRRSGECWTRHRPDVIVRRHRGTAGMVGRAHRPPPGTPGAQRLPHELPRLREALPCRLAAARRSPLSPPIPQPYARHVRAQPPTCCDRLQAAGFRNLSVLGPRRRRRLFSPSAARRRSGTPGACPSTTSSPCTWAVSRRRRTCGWRSEAYRAMQRVAALAAARRRRRGPPARRAAAGPSRHPLLRGPLG